MEKKALSEKRSKIPKIPERSGKGKHFWNEGVKNDDMTVEQNNLDCLSHATRKQGKFLRKAKKKKANEDVRGDEGKAKKKKK